MVGEEDVRRRVAGQVRVFPDLQEAAGVVLLDDLQTVLHQTRGLAELHRAVGDLVPHHLGERGGEKDV